jgi:UrcA family protein
MNTIESTRQIRVVRPKITLAMILCGVVGAAGIGAVSAATPDDESLSVAVKYHPQDLSTQDGARALYRKLVRAAEAVCPTNSANPFLPGAAVAECRAQSVARAVFKINNPSLVAVYNASTKHG